MTTIINGSPRYPGDSICTALLQRMTQIHDERTIELGDVRIQWYGLDNHRVAAFTPGYETSSPGDTPKMNPGRSEWCNTASAARRIFDSMLTTAHKEGWLDYNPNAPRPKLKSPLPVLPDPDTHKRKQAIQTYILWYPREVSHHENLQREAFEAGWRKAREEYHE